MNFVGSMNRIRAVNAATGELLWEYDPKASEHTGNVTPEQNIGRRWSFDAFPLERIHLSFRVCAVDIQLGEKIR
jgi:hypothetical protein